MHIDYSYVLVISSADEPRLRELVNMHGSIEQVFSESECEYVTLDFPLDEVLFRYLRDDVIGRRRASNQRWQSPSLWIWLRRHFGFRKRDYPEYFPSASTGRVDSILMYSHLHPATQQLYVVFSAATSRMSLLLQHSPSIRQWFLHLAAQLQAAAVFLDLEDEGYEVIYHQGQPLLATLTEDLVVKQAPDNARQAIQTICRNYNALFKPD